MLSQFLIQSLITSNWKQILRQRRWRQLWAVHFYETVCHFYMNIFLNQPSSSICIRHAFLPAEIIFKKLHYYHNVIDRRVLLQGSYGTKTWCRSRNHPLKNVTDAIKSLLIVIEYLLTADNSIASTCTTILSSFLHIWPT